MRVLFLHGLEGSPTGIKATAIRTRLESLGVELVAPLMPKDDHNNSLEIAAAEIGSGDYGLVVASSRGANIALAIDHKIPTLALAPSLRFFPVTSVPTVLTVVHGVLDDVAPLGEALLLVENFGARLVVVRDGHRLGESIPVILDEMSRLLVAIRS